MLIIKCTLENYKNTYIQRLKSNTALNPLNNKFLKGN